MQPPARQISTCPTCGAALEETFGGGGGCMFCLLQAGIGSEQETVHDSTPDAPEGGVRFGVYEIDCHADGSLCELGRGAMGVTYRATDTSLQRKVALKIIKTDIAERSADARERFLREARAAAALRHENIAVIHQFGMRLETGQYFYAMELIEGETLDERVRRAGPLDARTTIGIAQQVTSALAAAEKHLLVHRDLKPANLMLVKADDPEAMGSDQARFKRSRIRALRKSGIPVVKIIDFGLAKAFHIETDPKSLTHDRFVGTPAFASPEQFEHAALDVRSDIYSLGETLWFALTGKAPFAGRTLSEIHRAQKSNALPFEQLKAAHVPHRLNSLLESMLAFEPASRPGTRELAARLYRSSPEAKSARRTRLALAAAAVVVLGMSTLFVFRPSRIQNASLNPAPDKSIAVLPFENQSEEESNAYFADGIQDEILTRLSKIADLKVISRTSTQHYKSTPENLTEIARRLGVAHILEGSVQKSGDAVRVNVQLIKAANDSHVWADTFDRKLTDIFAVESEVAEKIAASLRARLSGREQQALESRPTDDPEAYDLYLRGRYLLNKRTVDSIQKGRALFEEAVMKDRQFALGHAGIADAYILLGEYGAISSAEASKKAWPEVSSALEIDGDLAEAHCSRAQLLSEFEWNWNDAGIEFRKAIELNPNSAKAHHWYAFHLSQLGRSDDALREINAAQKQDPLSPIIYVAKGKILWIAHRNDEAIEQCRKALDLEPTFAPAFFIMAHTYTEGRQYVKAIDAARKYVEITGNNPPDLVLAYAYAAAGNKDGSAKIVHQQIAHPGYSFYDLATIYAAWHNTADALQSLESAIDERSLEIAWIRVDPRIDKLRTEPRFRSLEMRVISPH
jgi:serine/threonine protein kinase/Tfp pilus assembly protein PilF